LWWLPNKALLLVEHWHRRRSVKMRRAWAHTTTAHVKSLRHKAEFNISHWRLQCEDGRQRWFYDPKHKQSWFERYQLGLEKYAAVKPAPTPDAALDRGVEFLTRLQDTDGHWANDYSGPLFLLPGAIFASFIINDGNTENMFTAEKRSEMARYIKNTQNEDGGWGMHTEGHSIMFGTVLNYVALRLLGEKPSTTTSRAAQRWLEQNGGAQSIASWGKVWLAVLGLYSWEGLNPVPPEMWLLPSWLPLCMGRVWCHSRIVTLPFGYLYGVRFTATNVPVLDSLREELYPGTPFARMDWPKQRNNVHAGDWYVPHSGLYDFGAKFLHLYEKYAAFTTKLGKKLRGQALAETYEHIHYDDVNSHFICLGPVNKTLNMVITWLHNGRNIAHPDVKAHLERLDDYLWMGPEGMRMAGYNGSQLWDTSFSAQAMCATQRYHDSDVMKRSLIGAHRYVNVAQVREDPPDRERFFRSPTKGCWNFSTRDQGWQVSDCTAEGLRVVLLLHKAGFIPRADRFDLSRVHDAVDEILALRSTEWGTGAWGSYEEVRGPKWLELLNCAEVYKDIMVEYEYIECTSSCVQTLCMFREDFPEYRRAAIDKAVRAGVDYIKRVQRPDGSWYGSWGVCFTYAAFFAVEALKHSGEPVGSEVYAKNRRFLMSKQNADGGWGEDFNSCVTEVYTPNADGSQVVNTAWSLMALIGPGWATAGAEVDTAIERGVQFLMSRQLADGDWAQERISGVFNGNCAIHYASYKNNMPVWALAMYTATKRNEARR
jgi:lanosterol synthase